MLFQSRTNNCGELRLADAGKTVTLAGWMENVREVGANFAFIVLRFLAVFGVKTGNFPFQRFLF